LLPPYAENRDASDCVTYRFPPSVKKNTRNGDKFVLKAATSSPLPVHRFSGRDARKASRHVPDIDLGTFGAASL